MARLSVPQPRHNRGTVYFAGEKANKPFAASCQISNAVIDESVLFGYPIRQAFSVGYGIAGPTQVINGSEFNDAIGP